jgi:hypothetical protein
MKTVVGSYSNLELLTESAKGADVVIAVVSAYALSGLTGSGADYIAERRIQITLLLLRPSSGG